MDELHAVSKSHQVELSFDFAVSPVRGLNGTFLGFPLCSSGTSLQHTQFGSALSSSGMLSYAIAIYSQGSLAAGVCCGALPTD